MATKKMKIFTKVGFCDQVFSPDFTCFHFWYIVKVREKGVCVFFLNLLFLATCGCQMKLGSLSKREITQIHIEKNTLSHYQQQQHTFPPCFSFLLSVLTVPVPISGTLSERRP